MSAAASTRRGLARRRKHVALAAIAVALAAAGAVHFWPSRASTASADGAETKQQEPRLAWEQGKKYVYALAWRGDSTMPVAGAASMNARAKIEADLVVRSLGEKDGAYELVMSLKDIRAYDVTMQGKKFFDEAGTAFEKNAIESTEALVRIDPRGGVRSISFRKTTPAKLREVLERFVQAMRVSLPEQRAQAWQVIEPTVNGTADSRYVLSPEGDRTFLRTRVRYTNVAAFPAGKGEETERPQELTGSATIHLDDHGAIESIHDEERLEIAAASDQSYVTETTFAIVRKAVEPFDVNEIQVAALDQDRNDGTKTTDPKEHDEQLASRTSPAEIRGNILTGDHGAKLPKGFVVHAGAYLRLHPEEDRVLVTLFGSSDLGATGRGLVLDVLSVAGDHDAQAAMRDALSLDVAREDKDAYTMGLQRFIFLRTPERESAAFLVKVLDDAEAAHDVRTQGASAVALGGVIRSLRRTGERDAAEQYHGRLLRDLGHASPGDERVYMLRAVGNAAAAGDESAITAYAKDPDRVVRDQVAHSLRHVASPAAHQALFSLAEEADDMVATTAIRALRDQTMTEAEWSDLAARVARGKTNQESDSAMVNLVRERQSEAGPSGEAILRAILARTSPSNPDLLATIRALLGIEVPG
jgi:hypothetical protein